MEYSWIWHYNDDKRARFSSEKQLYSNTEKSSQVLKWNSLSYGAVGIWFVLVFMFFPFSGSLHLPIVQVFWQNLSKRFLSPPYKVSHSPFYFIHFVNKSAKQDKVQLVENKITSNKAEWRLQLVFWTSTINQQAHIRYELKTQGIN